MDLTGRLGRLEDLFMDISTQLLPALTKIIYSFSPSDQQEEPVPSSSVTTQETQEELTGEPPEKTIEELAKEASPPPRKRLWTKMLNFKKSTFN